MQIGIVSGLPPLQAGRKVTIYSPARTAGQQGVSQTALGEQEGGRCRSSFVWRPHTLEPVAPAPPARPAACKPAQAGTLGTPLCQRRHPCQRMAGHDAPATAPRSPIHAACPARPNP